MANLICPCHDDNRPSMTQYADSLYCWVCRARLTYEEYYKLTGQRMRAEVAPDRPREDIDAGLRYIATLPKVSVRGLQFPTDDLGYYIVWPNAKYYKRRNYSDIGPKYLCPTGHRAPLLVANQPPLTGLLLIVEGEINALSVAKACPELGVCSPGSAGDFTRKDFLTSYLAYSRQVLLMDEDDAGAIGAIGLSALLRPLSKDVQIMMFKKRAKGGQGDANEIYESQGKEALKEAIYKRIQASLVREM